MNAGQACGAHSARPTTARTSAATHTGANRRSASVRPVSCPTMPPARTGSGTPPPWWSPPRRPPSRAPPVADARPPGRGTGPSPRGARGLDVLQPGEPGDALNLRRVQRPESPSPPAPAPTGPRAGARSDRHPGNRAQVQPERRRVDRERRPEEPEREPQQRRVHVVPGRGERGRDRVAERHPEDRVAEPDRIVPVGRLAREPREVHEPDDHQQQGEADPLPGRRHARSDGADPSRSRVARSPRWSDGRTPISGTGAFPIVASFTGRTLAFATTRS